MLVMSSGFQIDSSGGTGLLIPDSERASQRPGHGAGGDLPPIDWDDFGGGGGGGGDDEDSGESFEEESRSKRRSAAELGLGLGLVSIGILFLVFLAAYAYLARSADEWPPVDAPNAPLGLWLSTLVLVGSSFCMLKSVRAMARGREDVVLSWLLATLACGAVFLSLQIQVWAEMHRAGMLPSSHGYGAIFYSLTGLHGAHILAGVAYLTSLIIRVSRRREPRVTRTTVRLCGVYWHFMGVLWIVLFCALYLPL